MAEVLAHIHPATRGRVEIAVSFCAGTCPACREGGARVHRRNARSVTMRCRNCGLQWTMTAKQMADAMRRQAEAAKGKPYERILQIFATEFAEWAADVNDPHGS